MMGNHAHSFIRTGEHDSVVESSHSRASLNIDS